MAIKDSDGVIIPSHVSQLETGTAKFLVTFNPTSLGTHTVNITFNKEVIKGACAPSVSVFALPHARDFRTFERSCVTVGVAGSPFEVNIVDSLTAPSTGGDTST